jgi:hypothetical protein
MDELQKARELISKGKYAEARKILTPLALDSQDAVKLLEIMNTIEPSPPIPKRRGISSCWFISFGVLLPLTFCLCLGSMAALYAISLFEAQGKAELNGMTPKEAETGLSAALNGNMDVAESYFCPQGLEDVAISSLGGNIAMILTGVDIDSVDCKAFDLMECRVSLVDSQGSSEVIDFNFEVTNGKLCALR